MTKLEITLSAIVYLTMAGIVYKKQYKVNRDEAESCATAFVCLLDNTYL